MRRRWILSLLLLLILLGGCAQSKAPELITFTEQHFTIGLPAGWAVQDRSESGDQVIFADPKAPDSFVAVYTLFVPPNVRWPALRHRWQFADRSPTPVKSPNGLDGILAEGPRQTDPAVQVLAIGYERLERWTVIAEAGAPQAAFAAQRPLFTAILQSLAPDPATDD